MRQKINHEIDLTKGAGGIVCGYDFSIWVIYDHPKDDPENFVARRWLTVPVPKPTSDSMVSPLLETLRETLRDRMLQCIGRHLHDDPVIVEVWV